MSFNPVAVNGDVWSFEHLKSFSFTYTIVTAGASMAVQVDVVFSCHCFTRSFSSGPPPPSNDWVYKTATETRILDRTRFEHSRDLLPDVIRDFDTRRILFASTENYMTIDATSASGVSGHYQVFFTVKRKEGVKGRVELRIQSAYFVDFIHRQARPQSMRPVRFKLIVTAAYERRILRPGK